MAKYLELECKADTGRILSQRSTDIDMEFGEYIKNYIEVYRLILLYQIENGKYDILI